MENKEIIQKEYDLSHLIVEAAPHQRSAVSIQRIMLDVIIALIPALIVSVYEFGMRSLVLVLSAVIACVLSEYCYQKIMKQPSTISDLSAVGLQRSSYFANSNDCYRIGIFNHNCKTIIWRNWFKLHEPCISRTCFLDGKLGTSNE